MPAVRHQLNTRALAPVLKAIVITLLFLTTAFAQDFGRPSSLPSAPATFTSGGSGKIGPGDLLEVTVFDTPELSGKARVSNSGEVSLPLLGMLHVSGLTTDQAQSLVAASLVEKQLVKEPQVSVFVSEYATQGVSVLGEVKHPGIFPSLGQHRLLDYISLAEGLGSACGLKPFPRSLSPARTAAASSFTSTISITTRTSTTVFSSAIPPAAMRALTRAGVPIIFPP